MIRVLYIYHRFFPIIDRLINKLSNSNTILVITVFYQITPGNFTKLKYDVAIAESRNRDNKRHQPKLSAMRLRSSIAKSEDKLKRRLEKRWREYFLTKQSRPILSLVHESDIRTTTPDSFTAEEMQS